MVTVSWKCSNEFCSHKHTRQFERIEDAEDYKPEGWSALLGFGGFGMTPRWFCSDQCMWDYIQNHMEKPEPQEPLGVSSPTLDPEKIRKGLEAASKVIAKHFKDYNERLRAVIGGKDSEAAFTVMYKRHDEYCDRWWYGWSIEPAAEKKPDVAGVAMGPKPKDDSNVGVIGPFGIHLTVEPEPVTNNSVWAEPKPTGLVTIEPEAKHNEVMQGVMQKFRSIGEFDQITEDVNVRMDPDDFRGFVMFDIDNGDVKP